MAELGVNRSIQKMCTKPFLGEEHSKEASPWDIVSLGIPLV